MPPRKRQHYIPQLYMRGFTDTERLPSYQLDRREEFPPTPIRNLCYENYFYDEDGEIEETMGELEGEFARVLREVKEAESVSVLPEGSELNLFLAFITYTHARTKAAKEETNEFATEFTKLLLDVGVIGEDNDEMRESVLESLQNREMRIEATSAFTRYEIEALLGHILIADLEPVVLKDMTGRGFAFSDHPAVLDNPAFKHELDIGTLGWKTRGLQVSLPLSTNLCLLLYDPVAYTRPADPSEVLPVGSDVVEELNKLQLVHALDAVFYREHGREAEMQILHDEIEQHRRDVRPTIERVPGEDDRFNTNNDVMQFTRPTPAFSPDLPFIEERDCEFTPVRSPQLEALHETVVEEAVATGQPRHGTETSSH
ncbi:DUF4238 domain-containing protein [Natronomonas sp. F2-12]|uniref:DUF4238 domain-containing protein n=1 Tax=Natronomonas aquatica TaxID=2841590 RepID=A0A9R1D7I2_9EURY|nr:DUF4238 domain-containing protein [Natronomonas aquatica]MCQ4334882.1 DUF4238 domain-containing protein [Natronomonas aquatica]